MPQQKRPVKVIKARETQKALQPSDTSIRKRRQISGARFFSLKWKLMLASTGILILAALIIFVISYNISVRQLNHQIDIKGIRLIELLSQQSYSLWDWAMSRGDVKTFIDHIDSKQLIQAIEDDERLTVEAKETMKRWAEGLHERLKEILLPLGEGRDKFSDDVRDIIVQEMLDQNTVGIRNIKVTPGKQGWALGNQRFCPGYGDIKVTEGELLRMDELGGQSRTGEMGRVFTQTKQYGNNKWLNFYVILSLKAITDAQKNLFGGLMISIIISAIIGTGVSLFMSNLITKPIMAFANDVKVVGSGNLEHRSSVVSNDEIGVLVDTFNRMTEALKTAHEREVKQMAIQRELEIASEIQTNLLPKKIPEIPGWEILAYYKPYEEVGGDYYDFIPIDENHYGIIVADVSGKGIPAALVMSMFKAFVRMEAERNKNLSAADTIIKVNEMVAKELPKGIFVTAYYIILDLKKAEMLVTSAGHNPMLMWRASTKNVELINPSGVAVGIATGKFFSSTVKDQKVYLQKGDRGILYTDGVTETMNGKKEAFGIDRFTTLVKKAGHLPSTNLISTIVDTLDKFRGDAAQHDDITISMFRYIG